MVSRHDFFAAGSREAHARLIESTILIRVKLTIIMVELIARSVGYGFVINPS